MDEDEKMYIEGGTFLGTINTANCNKIAAMAAVGAGVLTVGGSIVTLIATCLGTPLAGAVAVCISGALVGMAGAVSGYFWLASAEKGMNAYYKYGTIVFLPKFS